MELSTAALAFIAIVATADSYRHRRKSSRPERREELAKQAAAYAEGIGGSGAEKLVHAIEAFGRLDLADNGKRDFTDTEARISIEAYLKSLHTNNGGTNG